jgi:hypothetical protein
MTKLGFHRRSEQRGSPTRLIDVYCSKVKQLNKTRPKPTRTIVYLLEAEDVRRLDAP